MEQILSDEKLRNGVAYAQELLPEKKERFTKLQLKEYNNNMILFEKLPLLKNINSLKKKARS